MKENIFILFFLLSTSFSLTSAETPNGKVTFDCPDMPDAKFQFHFTPEIIALSVTTPPFNTVENIYIQIYNNKADVFDRLVAHYSEKLKAENWHSLHENSSALLYVLEGPETQVPQERNVVLGVFVVIKSDNDVYLLNIVGNIPLQQTGELLANLSELGIEVSELKSLPALRLDEQSSSAPTRFRTADGFPIHEVQVQGNQKIGTSEIMSALEAGDENIEKAVETLRETMRSDLESVQTSIQEENEKRTAVITVKERSASPSSGTLEANPMLRFNRVTGWRLGSRLKIGLPGTRISERMSSSGIFGHVNYGFGNRSVDYNVGMDTRPFFTYAQFKTQGGTRQISDRWYHELGINARVHQTTAPITPDFITTDRISGPFALLYSLFGGEDLYDYYLKRGFEIGFRWNTLQHWRAPVFPFSHNFTLTLLAETHESLQKSTDWNLFNWRSTIKARENPIINPGRVRSVMFRYGWRNLRNRLGWYNTFSVEHSSSAFGSDFDFTRYQFQLRYTHPFGRHWVRTRAISSFSSTSLPIQRQFTIGGPGLLNGYPLYAFAGDNGYLFNIEYLYHLPPVAFWRNIRYNFGSDLFLVFFFDTGQVWNATDDTYTFVPKSDAGIGLQYGENNSILRLNIAQAFESEQRVRFNLLWFYSF